MSLEADTEHEGKFEDQSEAEIKNKRSNLAVGIEDIPSWPQLILLGLQVRLYNIPPCKIW